MKLSRRVERIETARPKQPTVDEFVALLRAGRIPDSRFDAAMHRLSDNELQRAIEMISTLIGRA